jgi:hypothetical protein
MPTDSTQDKSLAGGVEKLNKAAELFNKLKQSTRDDFVDVPFYFEDESDNQQEAAVNDTERQYATVVRRRTPVSSRYAMGAEQNFVPGIIDSSRQGTFTDPNVSFLSDTVNSLITGSTIEAGGGFNVFNASRFIAEPLARFDATSRLEASGVNVDELRTLKNGDAVLSAIPQDVLNHIKSYGYNPTPQPSADETVDNVLKLYGIANATAEKLDLFENGFSPIAGAVALGLNIAGDPTTWFGVGFTKPVSSFANMASRFSIKQTAAGFSARTGAGALMAIAGAAENVAQYSDDLFKLTNKNLSTAITSGAGITVAQNIISTPITAQYFEEAGMSYDGMTQFQEILLGAGGGAAFGGVMAGVFAGYKHVIPKVHTKIPVTKTIADTVKKTAGIVTPPVKRVNPKLQIPEYVVIEKRAELSEEIAYQLQRLTNNPWSSAFYHRERILNQNWWDSVDDSGIDQSMFLDWIVKNNPNEVEIARMTVDIEELAKYNKNKELNEGRIPSLEEKFDMFIENDLIVDGVPITFGASSNPKRNSAWFLSNIRQALSAGQPVTMAIGKDVTTAIGAVSYDDTAKVFTMQNGSKSTLSELFGPNASLIFVLKEEADALNRLNGKSVLADGIVTRESQQFSYTTTPQEDLVGVVVNTLDNKTRVMGVVTKTETPKAVAVDEKLLDEQALTLLTLVAHRASALGLTTDQYIARRIGDFIIDPKSPDFRTAALEKMKVDPKMREAWADTSKGKAIIYAFKDQTNFSSLVKELSTVFYKDLPSSQKVKLAKWLGTEDMQKWSQVSKDKFADAFLAYVEQGRVPTEGLRSVFAKMRFWLANLYQTITKSRPDIILNDDIIKIMDTMFTPRPLSTVGPDGLTYNYTIKPQIPENIDVDSISAPIGAGFRAGYVEVQLDGIINRALIKLMNASDHEERVAMMQFIRENTNMDDATIMYMASQLNKRVHEAVRTGKKKLRQASNPVVRLSVEDYEKMLMYNDAVGMAPKTKVNGEMSARAKALSKKNAYALDILAQRIYTRYSAIIKFHSLDLRPESTSMSWVYEEIADQLLNRKKKNKIGNTSEFISKTLQKRLARDMKEELAVVSQYYVTTNAEFKKILKQMYFGFESHLKVNQQTWKDLDPKFTNQPVEGVIYAPGQSPKVVVRGDDLVPIILPSNKELNKLVIPVSDFRNPTSAYARAVKAVDEARLARERADAGGNLEEINASRAEMRRSLRKLHEAFNKYHSPANSKVKVEVPATREKIFEFGVPEKLPGNRADSNEVAKILVNASEDGTLNKGNNNWLVYASSDSIRNLRKIGGLFDQGSLATVGSEIPIIARMSQLVSSHNLYTASFGYNSLVGPGLQQRKQLAVTRISRTIDQVNNVLNNVDDATRELVMKTAMAKINDVVLPTSTSPQIERLVNQVVPIVQGLYKEMERRGVASGYFRGTLDSYSGTFVVRNDRRDLRGLADGLFKVFDEKFSGPNAVLHKKTLQSIEGMWTRNTDTGEYIFAGLGRGYTEQPKLVSDLLPADKIRYFEILRSDKVDSDGVPVEGLRREAHLAARNKLGMPIEKAQQDLALTRPDVTLERAVQVDAWFHPEVSKFIDFRPGESLNQYTRTVYRISEQEAINAFVKQLLGVSRRDIGALELVDGIEDMLLRRADLDEKARDAIKNSTQYLRNQFNSLRDSSYSDITRKQGITDDLADIVATAARIPVSARSALASSVTEVPMILINTAVKDGAHGFSRLIRDTLKGMTKDQLKGITAGYLWMRNRLPHTLASSVDSVTINRNWLERTFINPSRVVVGSEGLMNKAKSVVAWLHHTTSGIAGEDLLQGFASAMAVHAASVRLIRLFDNIEALAKTHAAYNWADEVDPEAVFKKMASDHGFGEDITFAARLNQAGLLNPDIIQKIREMDSKTGGRLLDGENGSLDYGLLEELKLKNPQYTDAVDIVNSYKETELTRHVVTPGVQDVNTPMGGMDPWTKLKNQFTGFARAWFNNIMLNNIANEKLAYGLFLISVALFGETLYNVSLRTLYGDESLEETLNDWAENPIQNMMLTVGRSNIVGTSNIIPMTIIDIISDRPSSQVSAATIYPISSTAKTLKSMANVVKDGLSSTEEIDVKDASRIESMVPLFNAWWMKQLTQTTGYDGISSYLYGKQEQPAN